MRWDSSIRQTDKLILADPQTFGGLLIVVPAEKAGTTVNALLAAGVAGVRIGEIIQSEGPPIYVSK